MATKNTAETEADTDSPLIDLNEADVKKLIARGKKRGYLTYDELNAALPQDEMSSEQIEDIMSAISDMGINIVESDEDVQEEADQEADDEVDISAGTGSVSNPAIEKKKETVDRTDDPVRMYLREMGAVELLSREGEIAIAKRIEAGRDTMILGLCESPLTFNAIIDWSTALNNGDMQLREIVDLEAMLSKDPAPENLDDEGAEDDGEISEKTAGVSFKDEDEVEEEPAAESDDEDGEVSSGKRESFEEDEEDNTLSLAAMEELLKPDALEKFANITKSFKAFSKLQETRLEALSSGDEFPAASEKKYHKLREELTAQVESVQFHNTKIEYLVDQLYSYNRRLTALGGQMLRLAERHKEGSWVVFRISNEGRNGAWAASLAGLIPEDDAILAQDRARLSEVRAARAARARATTWASCRNCATPPVPKITSPKRFTKPKSFLSSPNYLAP